MGLWDMLMVGLGVRRRETSTLIPAPNNGSVSKGNGHDSTRLALPVAEVGAAPHTPEPELPPEAMQTAFEEHLTTLQMPKPVFGPDGRVREASPELQQARAEGAKIRNSLMDTISGLEDVVEKKISKDEAETPPA